MKRYHRDLQKLYRWAKEHNIKVEEVTEQEINKYYDAER